MSSSIAISGRQKLIAIILGIVAVFLCIHAYSAAIILKHDNHVSGVSSATNKQPSMKNFFLGADYSAIIEQNYEVEEVMKPLEFMVWSQERRKISVEASDVLHAQINKQPFNAYLWRQLTFAQIDSGVSDNERIWTLTTALKFARWNSDERSYLTHHCMHSKDSFKDSAPKLCKELLHKLPNLSVRDLARKTGVSYRQVQKILLQEGLLNSEKTKKQGPGQ